MIFFLHFYVITANMRIIPNTSHFPSQPLTQSQSDILCKGRQYTKKIISLLHNLEAVPPHHPIPKPRHQHRQTTQSYGLHTGVCLHNLYILECARFCKKIYRIYYFHKIIHSFKVVINILKKKVESSFRLESLAFLALRSLFFLLGVPFSVLELSLE